LGSKTRIAVVEDHDFYRNGLCMAIKRIKFVELAFEAINGKDFLEKLQKNPVDIALVDVVMPVMGGYEIVRELKKKYPGIKIAILTMLDEEENIQRFIEAGVDGYMLKNIDHQSLEIALKAIIDGQNYYSTEIMSYLTRQLRTRRKEEKTPQLSPRELEILQLIYEGYSNQEMAEKLFISVRTITNHRFNIMQKTGVKNTAGLINYGIKNKLLRL
jgi:DNA-binding NarL/FixJ family response regulator